MEIRFDDKVVMITGAAGGLGSAMAAEFAKSGAKVALCDLKGAEAKAAELAENGCLKGYSFDITNREQVKTFMAQIAADMGKIDVLINNAGINVGPDQRKTVDEFDDGWWDRILNVDLNGTYNCSKAVVPYMKDGGVILNISSIVGMVPLRNQCSFTAAKAAVINFSKAMAMELAPKNIRVNVICPGTIGIAITNELWKADGAMQALLAHIPMGRQGRPSDIANAAMFMCSDFASYINGAVLPVDGGWTCGGYARNF